LIRWLTHHAQCAEVLHPSNFVAGGAVVFSDLRFNNYLRIEFAGNYKIRCLVETGQALRSFSLSIANARGTQYAFNYILHAVADQFRNRVSMPGKRTAKKPFVQEHCIRSAKFGYGLKGI